MLRTALALVLALALTVPAFAKSRHTHRPVCVPVTIEGVGTVWVSARPPRRR